MIRLSHDELIKHMDYFNNTREYVPLVLHRYLGLDYYKRIPKKVEMEFYKNRTKLMGTDDYNRFLEDELKEWLKTHEEFNDIIINE